MWRPGGVTMIDSSKRRTLIACGGIGICVIVYGVYLGCRSPLDGPLPRIVARVPPTPIGNTSPNILPVIPPETPKVLAVATAENSGRLYEPRTQAEWDGWKKASDLSVPNDEVIVAVELRVTRPEVQPSSDGTVVVSGSKEVTVEGSFEIAEDIPSLPPLAYFELVTIAPTGGKLVLDSVRVTDVKIDGKKYTVRASVLRSPRTGSCRATLDISGRVIAQIPIRFE